MSGITLELAKFVASLSPKTIPVEVTERTKLLVMDTVGIALRARHDTESTEPMMRAMAALGLSAGTSRVIGDDATTSAPGAALINGALAHSLDFDDTHAAGSIHPSAPIMPAAFAAAEMVGADGATTLAGITAGYEVQIRLSLALGPRDHYLRGYHPTATGGAFGAAAAAGASFGLSAEQIASSFGIASSQTAGSLQFLSGAWTKRFQAGHAAMNGLVAASFAREGYVGSQEAFTGEHGFLTAYAPNPQPEKVVAGLGEVWETLNIAVKPYPSCRYSHAPMNALLQLAREHGIAANDIQSAEIGVSTTGWNIIGDSDAVKHEPRNAVDGQFSMPFCAAVVLRQGDMGWDDYDRHLNDPATRDLTRRITTVVDPKAEAEFPANMSGIARITTADGTFEAFVKVPKGEPDNFLTADELRAKFDALVAPYLSDTRRAELADVLLGLEKEADIARMLTLTEPDLVAKMRMAGED
jgi:2-methylcitrate dehydratase PrpD